MAEFASIFESDDDTDSVFSGFTPSEIPSDFSDLEVGYDDDSSSDESDTDVDPLGAWTSDFQQPTIEPFTETPGVQLPAGFDATSATPLQYFLLMFPLELIGFLTTMTNRYAAWKMTQPGVNHDTRWEETTMGEMRTFLALNILMGINRLPTAEMFWSTNNMIGNAAVASTMTCNRFQKLVQYFHVSDRGAEPGRGHPDYDRLYKIRPITDAVSTTFRRFYTMSREVSVDEAMIGLCGRLAFRQYMPDKPITRGIKVWMLCDAQTAYLSRFEVYLGRQTNAPEHGLGYNVVSRLTDHLHHTHRWVFFDNCFTSIELMENLLDHGLYACGIVRSNRKGFPAELKKPTDVRERGQSKVLQKRGSNLTAVAWKYKNKIVNTLSTLSNPAVVMPAQRRSGAHILDHPQPDSVFQYNTFMGGVNRHDQHWEKYDVGRKGKKAWGYLFWFLVDCSIVNAFILYKSTSSRPIKKKRYSHLDFRMELINELLVGSNKRKRPTPEHGQ